MQSLRPLPIALLTWVLLTPLAFDAACSGQTFTIVESFGVDHPRQIVDFDLDQPIDRANSWLMGPDGKECAYQLIAGGRKLAVACDLPAGASKTWTIATGRAPVAKGSIRVDERRDAIEITNGLVGVRVPRAQKIEGRAPAPILALRLRSGAWVGEGAGALLTPVKSTVQRAREGLDWPYEKNLGHELAALDAREIQTEFLESGDLKTVVQIIYRFDRPAGAAYRCVIEVFSEQPSILITEEARNVEVVYELGLNGDFRPDTARYRGVDPQKAGLGDERETKLEGTLALRTFVWDAWSDDGGVQVSAFRREDSVAGDLLGTFPGPTSRALGARGSGTFLTCLDGRIALRMQLYHSLPDGQPYRHNRFSWGLFAGRRGDVREPDQIQPIDLERNRLSGINLNKIHRMKLSVPEPPGKFGALYMPRAAMDKMTDRLRSDAKYRDFLYDAEPTFRPLLFLLDDPALHADPGGRRVREVADRIEATARETLRILVHEMGTEDKRVHNYEGVFKVINEFYMADQVLASSEASKQDREKAMKAIVLFATIWTDDDHAPFQADTHLNYGSENMPLTYLSFRDMFALYLVRHPQFKSRAQGIVERTRQNLKTQINEHGAHMASMHYVEASFSALLNTMLQLKQAGAYDFFKNDAKNGGRLAKFAEFTLASLTPREPRYGVRKFIATGDSACESSDRCGVLGTAFAESNPVLSKRLMGAWRQNGSRHSSMFGSSVLKIDDSLPDSDPALKSIDVPGYFSMFREGAGTPNETAVWFINGDWYRDHKHAGDGGEVIIYALGAPLSLDPGSMYTPHLPRAEHHSVVHGAGLNPREQAFKASNPGGFARATFDLAPLDREGAKWTRAVSLALLASDLPVIAVQDRFSTEVERVCQFNFMSQGEAKSSVVAPGIERISVVGQDWKLHPAGGIDWDVFIVSTQPRTHQWGEIAHHWNPVVEMSQFAEANGREFEETQQTLRTSGRGGFRAFIVPYWKGRRPADLTVKAIADDVQIAAGGKSIRFHRDGSFSE